LDKSASKGPCVLKNVIQMGLKPSKDVPIKIILEKSTPNYFQVLAFHKNLIGKWTFSVNPKTKNNFLHKKQKGQQIA